MVNVLRVLSLKFDGDGVTDLHAEIFQPHPLQHEFVFLRGPGSIHEQIAVHLLVFEVGNRFQQNVAGGGGAGDDAREDRAAAFRRRRRRAVRAMRGGQFFVKRLGADDRMGNGRVVAVGMKFAQHDRLDGQHAADRIDAHGDGQRDHQRAHAVIP